MIISVESKEDAIANHYSLNWWSTEDYVERKVVKEAGQALRTGKVWPL